MHIYALFFIVFGWAIFAFDQTKVLGQWLSAMFLGRFQGAKIPFANAQVLFYLRNYGILFIILRSEERRVGKEC